MKIAIHAGHNKQGYSACGACGYIDESKEAREIVNLIKTISAKEKSKVQFIDCTINKPGYDKYKILKEICTKSNNSKVDLVVSVHFNACRMERADNKTKGVEVWTYDKNPRIVNVSKQICANIAKVGLKNRGVKQSKSLYVLKNTVAKALLIEVCFVDDADDVKVYKANKEKIARGILKAIEDY